MSDEPRCEHCTHYSHGECWEAAMKMVREADSARVDAVVELEKALDLLDELEWSSNLGQNSYGCGICQAEAPGVGGVPGVHYPGCRLKAALESE